MGNPNFFVHEETCSFCKEKKTCVVHKEKDIAICEYCLLSASSVAYDYFAGKRNGSVAESYTINQSGISDAEKKIY